MIKLFHDLLFAPLISIAFFNCKLDETFYINIYLFAWRMRCLSQTKHFNKPHGCSELFLDIWRAELIIFKVFLLKIENWNHNAIVEFKRDV